MKMILKIIAPLFLSLILVNPASAHTSLLDSMPKRDSIIATMPKEIILVFGEDLLTIDDSKNNYFEVFDSTNTKMSLSEVSLDGPRLSAKVLNDQIKSGKYSISYRVVAGDGHVVKGIVKFTIEKGKSNSELPVVNLFEPTPAASQNSNRELVNDNFENHDHANFFNHHLEHILMVGIPLMTIITWYFVRRKYSDS